MRSLFLLGLVLLAGCQSSGGGLGQKQGRADDPMFSISEQERRGRERYSYVEDYSNLAPKTYVDRPSVTGR